MKSKVVVIVGFTPTYSNQLQSEKFIISHLEILNQVVGGIQLLLHLFSMPLGALSSCSASMQVFRKSGFIAISKKSCVCLLSFPLASITCSINCSCFFCSSFFFAASVFFSACCSSFVSFAFRKTVTPENDINDFAFFNEYLQPTEPVITYATVIRFLGNAAFVKNITNTKNLIVDEYERNGKKIEVYYSLGKKTKIPAPAGDYTAYDMYGNETQTGRKLTVSSSPVYIIY